MNLCARCGRRGQAHFDWRGCWRFKPAPHNPKTDYLLRKYIQGRQMKVTCRTLDCTEEFDLELDVKEYPEVVVTNELGMMRVYRHLNRPRTERGYYVEVTVFEIDAEKTPITYRHIGGN